MAKKRQSASSQLPQLPPYSPSKAPANSHKPEVYTWQCAGCCAACLNHGLIRVESCVFYSISRFV